ncbi:hypothetical protein L6452_28330 [Arctium lappa]|uniref:Uncharacterized protein n=1 Tax=Arctium lappa TaxID=4217 RepID=A0ACB8ZYM3_ARCLA|nr:hypothetical protein L6452_28330 [Arctium lappa]
MLRKESKSTLTINLESDERRTTRNASKRVSFEKTRMTDTKESCEQALGNDDPDDDFVTKIHFKKTGSSGAAAKNA